MEFDSRGHSGVPALGDARIEIPFLTIEFGSQTIFPGNETPTLEWFETVIPSQIMPGVGSFSASCTPRLEFGHFPLPLPDSASYDLTNTAITHSAPEPATACLMLIGAITALRRRRRRQ